MKTLLMYPLRIAIVLFAFLVSGCIGKDVCKTTCQNGGVCQDKKCICPVDYVGKNCEVFNPCGRVTCPKGHDCYNGVCACPAGYEGDSCTIISREKFIGNWAVFEQGSLKGMQQYPVTIEGGAEIYEVVIRNFYNRFPTINAYVHGDTLFIPEQVSDGKRLVGWGISITQSGWPSVAMHYMVLDQASNAIDNYGYNSGDSTKSEWVK